ncbi:MAG: RNA 2',3'-cyclic phosphodiesterase [Candidatus Micrarchaeia archaeon]
MAQVNPIEIAGKKESGTVRSFIAVDLPDDVKNKISGFYSVLKGLDVRSVRWENLHITIMFLGNINNEQLDAARSAIENIEAQKFLIELRGIGAFSLSNPRVLFINIKEGAGRLRDIYSKLAGRLSDSIHIEEREFVPHLTIARAGPAKDRAKIASIIDSYSDYEFGSFECNAITLKASKLTSAGPFYRDLFLKELV